MKIIFYLIAGLLALFGFLFIVGSQGMLMRIVIGIILFAAAGGLVYLSRVQPQHTTTTIKQDIHLSGNVNLETLKCQKCGGALENDSVSVKAGAVFVSCPYCGAAYQIEEDIKW